MKQICLVLIFCLLLAAAAAAQPASNGYLFVAPGQIRAAGAGVTQIHFGGGGEFVGKSGLGLGAELGIAGPTSNFGNGDFGLFSLNGSFHFSRPPSKFDPYVTGGYSRSFGHHAGANWGNLGFGLNYWFRDKLGAKVEFRDHLHRESGVTLQLWEIRFGVSLR